MQSFWIFTPPDNMLSTVEGWDQHGPNSYSTSRHVLLVVRRDSSTLVNGPAVEIAWPQGTEFTLSKKTSWTTKSTVGIQESITSTVAAKISRDLVLSMKAVEAGLTPKVVLGEELTSKISAELSASLQENLSRTTTYTVETLSEEVQSFKVTLPADGKVAEPGKLFIYFKLRKVTWDVYLYRVDQLQFEFKRNWLWKQVRETSKSEEIFVGSALFRIEYYEPVGSPNAAGGNYVADVEQAQTPVSIELTGVAPTNIDPPKVARLIDLAKIAPPTASEKKAAKKAAAKKGSGEEGCRQRRLRRRRLPPRRPRRRRPPPRRPRRRRPQRSRSPLRQGGRPARLIGQAI